MRDLGKVIAHIPARAGSKRVKAKNLRILSGQPLLSYAIHCAKQCTAFDDVYVNSNSADMLALAECLGVKGYQRSEELASDTATGDEFTVDFIREVKPDTLVMISPVCPLVTAEDVSAALEAFRNSDCDTLITCESTRMQTFCNDTPVNISLEGQLAPTQENPSVDVLNWAVTIWDAEKFLEHFNATGSAYIGKNRLLFPIDPIRGLKISNEPDFKMAESLISALSKGSKEDEKIEYWSVGNNCYE